MIALKPWTFTQASHEADLTDWPPPRLRPRNHRLVWTSP